MEVKKQNKINEKDLLREMKARKIICQQKLDKLSNRIKILENFQNQPSGKKMNLKDYLNTKGINFKDFFSPIGYYTTEDKVVSADKENNRLSYAKGMVNDQEIGFPIAVIGIVTSADQDILRNSETGMRYNSESKRFEPKHKFDCRAYALSEDKGDIGMDIMGGLTMNDIASLHNRDENGKNYTDFVKELIKDEFNSVMNEYDVIEEATDKLYSDMGYSNADGDESKSKRDKRKENREERDKARKEFREEKKDCKAKYNSGDISRKEYKECLKKERKEKREDIKEAGGNLFRRTLRAYAKVLPITAITRNGVLLLTDINTFGFATRLAPAVIPDAEAKEIFNEKAIQDAKKGWEKIKKIWIKMGGNPNNLEAEIIKGYRKKPQKVKSEMKSKSGFDGIEYSYSNAVGEVIGAVSTGLSALSGLIAVLNSLGVSKNPYKDGKAPKDYTDALNSGVMDDVPSQEPDKPFLDPKTGEWIDPTTRKRIDPTTGKFSDDILGMNKWLAISLGVVGIFGIYYLFVKKDK